MKSDFPFFQHRPELTYLDSAATTQKPRAVLTAMQDFYEKHNGNVNRSAHVLSEESTRFYQNARQTVANFIGARHAHEVVFTRNATESINLVARSFGETFLKTGDEVLLSRLEHHSNLVPWLQLKEKIGIRLVYLDVHSQEGILFDPAKITPRTKLVAISGMSNVLGTITNIAPVVAAAHAVGASVLVDACQLAAHRPLQVAALGADFVAFSAHKLYGPQGVGVLYGRQEMLTRMPPFLGGGDMIHEVFKDHFSPAGLPQKFEAGTVHAAGAVALAAALDYLAALGWEKIQAHEDELTAYALKKLSALDFVELLGPPTLQGRGPVIGFTLRGVHPHDVAEGLSREGLCVRAGHHCCQVLMDFLHLPAAVRVSFGLYNEKPDIDRLIAALQKVHHYFS